MMRLREIEAIRFGEMSGRTLGPLGDRLTIVLGANESGKTTFTHLVRYLLFGFPKGNSKLPQFRPPGGEVRAGRLAFEDDEGTWTFTRIDGTKGGTCELVGPHGVADPQRFLDMVRQDVTEEVYASVFGFTVEELSSLSELEKIQAHLQATVSGLSVSPGAVRDKLADRLGALYRPGGKVQQINRTLSELKDTRSKMRELEQSASAMARERDQLTRLASEVAQAEALQRESATRAARLRAVVGRLRLLDEQIAADTRAADEGEAAVARLAERIAESDVDTDVAATAEALALLVASADDVEAALREVDEARRDITAHEDALDQAMAALPEGWTRERAQSLPVDASHTAALGEHKDALAAAQRAVADARAARDRAEAALGEAVRLAREATERAGLPAGADAVDVRLRREALSVPLAGRGSGSRSRVVVLASTLVLVAGVGIALLAGVNGRWSIVVVGAAMVAAAMALLAFALRIGLSGTGDADVARVLEERSALDEALNKWQAVDGAELACASARADLSGAEEALEAVMARWTEWLQAVGVDAAEAPSPSAGAALWERVRSVQGAAKDLEQAQERAAIAARPAERFAQRASEAGIVVDGDVWALLAAVRERAALAASEAAALTAREELEARKRENEDAVAVARKAADAARLRIETELAEAGIAGDLCDAEAALEIAETQAAEAEEAYRAVADEYARLTGALQKQDTRDESAQLSLHESELVGRLGRLTAEYAVAAVARELIVRTLSEYERTRQPAVVKAAVPILERITGGNYVRISAPHDRFELQLGESDGGIKTTDLLSSGTANQLYLALRLAYIDGLTDTCPQAPVIMDDVLVNFDDDRQARVASEIVRFAEKRQVVLLTCHESTAETFSRAVGEDAFTLLRL